MIPEEGFNATVKVFLGVIEIFIFHLSMYLSFFIRYKGTIPRFNFESYVSSSLYVTIFFISINILFGIYIYYNKSYVDLLSLTIIGQIMITITIMAVSFLGRWFTFPRTVLIINFFISVLFLYLWRSMTFKLYLKIVGTKRIILVGDKKECMYAYYNISQAKNERYEVTGIISGNIMEHLEKEIYNTEVVYVVSELSEKEKTQIFEFVTKKNKQLFLNTKFENLILINPTIINIEDESVIKSSPFAISPENGLTKRATDLFLALILAVLTSPVMLLTALAIKVTSKGPVFYKQVRITKNEKEFNILKFRSMEVSAEDHSGPVLATSNDPRVTKIGKIIRALRIDELPQLINVLKGDMSMIGPRPERPFFVEQFKKKNKYYTLRHNVRAGITGYAQVYGKYSSNFNSKLNFDLIYIKQYSLLLDAKIMLQTVKILFDKISSEGVQDVDKKLESHIFVLE